MGYALWNRQFILWQRGGSLSGNNRRHVETAENGVKISSRKGVKLAKSK
jgi:hypothetical protein